MIKSKPLVSAVMASVILILSQIARAQTPIWNMSTTIVRLEPSYIPTTISLMLKEDAGGCVTNNWLTYVPLPSVSAADRKDNIKAVYTTLLTAFTTGQKVHLHGMKKCEFSYVHIHK